jgi:hypothetical protein
MRKEPPLPPDVWDLIPAPAQAAVLALVYSLVLQNQTLAAQVVQLQATIAELTKRIDIVTVRPNAYLAGMLT